MTNPTPYTIRAIDGATFELLPTGALRLSQPRQEPIELAPELVYALYLFVMTPGIRPQLRALDDARQRQLWSTRYGSE